MENIAVIDTETNWIDETMSIGIVIANSNYQIIKKLYYILTPECNMGGMFQNVLLIDGVELSKKDSRKQVILSIKQELINNHVTDIFAYNALFDYYHLIELKNYIWHDIIKMAAYKQYNKMIPEEVKCFKTGRIIKGFGVLYVNSDITLDLFKSSVESISKKIKRFPNTKKSYQHYQQLYQHLLITFRIQSL